MPKRNKSTSVGYSVTIGVSIAVVLILLMIMIISELILKELLDIDNTDFIISTLLCVAIFTGSIIAGRLAGCKYGIICGLMAVLFSFLQIAINIIFFNGKFCGFVLNAISLIVGSGISCLILMKNVSGKRRSR